LKSQNQAFSENNSGYLTKALCYSSFRAPELLEKLMFSRINAEINSVFKRDPAAKTRLEVILCYPGFHALLIYRLSHWLWKKEWRLLARWFSNLGRWLTGIEIHPGATIGRNFFIDHGMGVVIGETASIGDDVTIYHGVTLGGVSLVEGNRHPQVGNNVIIGSGAQLLGPIIVGDNARIGSNAVVVKDVPENATMVGVPARNVSKSVGESDEKFTAYGVDAAHLPDVVMKNFDEMDKIIRELTARIAELEAQNKGLEDTAQKWVG
jgi:serine O-acetyltransferase